VSDGFSPFPTPHPTRVWGGGWEGRKALVPPCNPSLKEGGGLNPMSSTPPFGWCGRRGGPAPPPPPPPPPRGGGGGGYKNEWGGQNFSITNLYLPLYGFCLILFKLWLIEDASQPIAPAASLIEA
jgi:hypothetical protein